MKSRLFQVVCQRGGPLLDMFDSNGNMVSGSNPTVLCYSIVASARIVAKFCLVDTGSTRTCGLY